MSISQQLDLAEHYHAVIGDGRDVEGWKDPAGELVRTFAIITTKANASLAPVHDRMPVVLDAEDWALG